MSSYLPYLTRQNLTIMDNKETRRKAKAPIKRKRGKQVTLPSSVFTSESESDDDDDMPLPRQVNTWTRKDMGRLHIFYEGESEKCPQEFFQRFIEISDKDYRRKRRNLPSKELISLAKNASPFHHIELDLEIDDFQGLRLETEFLETTAQYIQDEIIKLKAYEKQKQFVNDMLKTQQSDLWKRCPGFLIEFISSFSNLNKFLELLKQILRQASLEVPVQKAMFENFFCEFSRCCMMVPLRGFTQTLHIIIGNETEEQQISSQPDVRFVTSLGSAAISDTELVTSVVELKCKVQKFNAVPKKKSRSSSDISTDEEFNINNLNSSVLAQHAGELLTDIYHTAFFPYIFGSIVFQTKVILTCMYMSSRHYGRIVAGSRPLQEDAKIYYTRPLDFLRSEDRKILFDNMILLGLTQQGE